MFLPGESHGQRRATGHGVAKSWTYWATNTCIGFHRHLHLIPSCCIKWTANTQLSPLYIWGEAQGIALAKINQETRTQIFSPKSSLQVFSLIHLPSPAATWNVSIWSLLLSAFLTYSYAFKMPPLSTSVFSSICGHSTTNFTELLRKLNKTIQVWCSVYFPAQSKCSRNGDCWWKAYRPQRYKHWHLWP